jgi:hypothetical protein
MADAGGEGGGDSGRPGAVGMEEAGATVDAATASEAGASLAEWFIQLRLSRGTTKFATAKRRTITRTTRSFIGPEISSDPQESGEDFLMQW